MEFLKFPFTAIVDTRACICITCNATIATQVSVALTFVSLVGTLFGQSSISLVVQAWKQGILSRDASISTRMMPI